MLRQTGKWTRGLPLANNLVTPLLLDRIMYGRAARVRENSSYYIFPLHENHLALC